MVLVGIVCVVNVVAAQHQPQQSSSQPPQQRPTFRGSARFVRVDVYPADRDGKPIEGLTAADFELYEDGKLQALDTFDFVRIEPEPEAIRTDPNSQVEGEALARDPRARIFAIVLDTRHVDIASGRALRQPLVQMLDRLIGPRDMFGVITPQLPASSFLLGRRTTTVEDMMARHWVWGSYDSILPQDNMEQLFDSCFGSVTSTAVTERQDPELTRELIARYRERQTLEHLDDLVDKLQAIREERKVVVLVTQGWRLFGENAPALARVEKLVGRSAVPVVTQGGGRIQLGTPPQRSGAYDNTECLAQATALFMRDSRRQFRELTDKAARANVAFYPIDPRGLAPFDQPISHGVIPPAVENARLKARAEGLRDLALNTDGIPFIMNNQLDAQLRRLSDALSAYYLLGYYSTNARFDGGYRRIEVKVRRPGVQVKARRGYYAPTEEEMASIAAGREAAARPPDAGEAAFADALARLTQVRYDRDLFLQTAIVPGALIVNVELGAIARTSPAWTSGGEIALTVTGAAQASNVMRLEPMRSGLSFRLPVEAPSELRVDVRARASGEGDRGAADASDIVRPGPQTLLGTVLSYRGIARALAPAADGRYRRTERATLEAAVADGAAPSGARLLDRAGKPLNVPIVSRERRDAGGVRWMSVEISLAPLTDGDYVVELEAMKDAARERRLFAIRVVR